VVDVVAFAFLGCYGRSNRGKRGSGNTFPSAAGKHARSASAACTLAKFLLETNQQKLIDNFCDLSVGQRDFVSIAALSALD
jgi:hypothetical protein